MLLQVLNDYARRQSLVEAIELTQRTVHLVLMLKGDGTVEREPWLPLESPDPKDRKGQKMVLGRVLEMPRFPGENNGGKAHFLADACGPALGIDPKTGRPVPDDPKVGRNATKAFLHFWKRIEDTHEATKCRTLAALLAFRSAYLATESVREAFPFAEVVPVGKAAKPTYCARVVGESIPLEGKVVTFQVAGLPIFEKGGPLHDYWIETYRREASPDRPDGEGLGLCLVTGQAGQPIAGSHKPEIKGVPNLPPKGGYLVSFAREAPALSSYGFEGSRNAPVSEQAVSGYTLALNALLRDARTARRIGDFVLCSWLRGHPEEAGELFDLLNDPDPAEVQRYFESFEKGNRRELLADRYYSLTLAANGGRVVVRRWLDVALAEVVENLKRWFSDLEIDAIETRLPAKGRRTKDQPSAEARPTPANYRALAFLARATVRSAEDLRAEIYDALAGAALGGETPAALLAPTLHRLRIAAVESGRNIRYHASRFALLKLILNRSNAGGPQSMTITRHLSETNDPSYNCGRLLAVLDDIQAAALDDIGADILARYYGRASTVPRNVFPSLIQLAQAHLKKIRTGKPGLEVLLDRKLALILALFAPDGPDGCPDFPGLMDPRMQGRFALGFYQQKAADQRERDAKAVEKARAKVNATPADQ